MKNAVEFVSEANTLMSRLKFPEAEACFRQAVALDPRNLGALLGLARIALLQERAEEAMPLLDRALSAHPEHPEALALIGMYWMAKASFDRAIETLERARAFGPALPLVHLHLGKCYSAVRRFGPAEESLRQSLCLTPFNCEAHTQLGLVQAETGRLKEAVDSLLAAIRIDPRYVKAYLEAGLLYERAGKTDHLVRLYRTGLRHNPGSLPLLERLASLHAARFEFRPAFAVAVRILRKRKGYGDYLRLGTYAIALKKLETAERAFRSALAIDPEAWEAHYNLAELYMSAQLMDQARDHYAAAVARGAGHYEPLNGMGLFALMVEHDYDRAIDLLCRARDLAPARPEPLLNLALAYAEKNDVASAEACANSVLHLAVPGHPLYQQAQRLKATLHLRNHVRKLN